MTAKKVVTKAEQEIQISRLLAQIEQLKTTNRDSGYLNDQLIASEKSLEKGIEKLNSKIGDCVQSLRMYAAITYPKMNLNPMYGANGLLEVPENPSPEFLFIKYLYENLIDNNPF